MVDSVERGDVGDRVGRKDHEMELVRVEDLVILGLEVPLRVRRLELVDGFHEGATRLGRHQIVVLEALANLLLVLGHEVVVVLHVLPAAELLHHHHLTLAHLGRHLQQSILHALLSHVDDVREAPLVLLLEVLQPLVERLILLGQSLHVHVDRLAHGFVLLHHELLQLLDLSNGPRPGQVGILALFLSLVLEEEHLGLLVLVEVGVEVNLLVNFLVVFGCEGGAAHHAGG
mmetsp:Transcript_2749/g.4703  ORF Transcript_2749/g.4703 Transcript_2749/m.4703 type:complete len:230 (+) Transcript_2749:594-1283(+)